MLSFMITSVLIELTPGPNMSWLAALGATRGRAMALAAVAGICLGLTIAAAIAGIGLSALLFEFPQLFTALRWAGALYLLYLAWEAWNDADGNIQIEDHSPVQAFMQGLISNILNPKAYVFYAAMLPPFIDPAKNAAQQIALLSLIYVGIATAIHAGIAVASGSISDWLARSSQAVQVRKLLALLIAAAAIWFFYSTRMT
jgi:threonine/homoserine/homoserine lactone efflux protein